MVEISFFSSVHNDKFLIVFHIFIGFNVINLKKKLSTFRSTEKRKPLLINLFNKNRCLFLVVLIETNI